MNAEATSVAELAAAWELLWIRARRDELSIEQCFAGTENIVCLCDVALSHATTQETRALIEERRQTALELLAAFQALLDKKGY